MAIEIGTIGMQIAEQDLEQNYHHLDVQMVNDLLERADYREIDEIIGLTARVSLTVDSINLSLAHRRKPPLPEGFKKCILQYEANFDLKKSSQRKWREISPEQQGIIAVDAMRHLHELWVREHEPEFFLPEFEQNMHQFMPLEMAGWEVAQRYLVYVRPIMLAVGLDGVERRRFHSYKEVTPEGDFVREAYRRAQHHLKTAFSISSTSSFYRCFSELQRHGYSVSPKIASALKGDDHLVFIVAAQVLRANPKGTFCPPTKEA